MIFESIAVEPLFVRLAEPFVIATARMEETRAGLVRVRLRDGDRVFEGIGEAATLPPVTREEYDDVAAVVPAIARPLIGKPFEPTERGLSALLDPLFGLIPVARAGVETAALDAIARARGVPLRLLFGQAKPQPLLTDITLPIADPDRMIELARTWRSEGFRCFKVKVGKDLDADVRALRGVHAAVPDATFRLDANEGYTADDALALLRAAASLSIECFEQPCRRVDLDGMARVARDGQVTVVADESVRSLDDLERVHEAGAATAVNLKLVKHGGPLGAHRIGRRARELGMRVMCGAMVETRLGLTAMAHVVTALGGADYVDLDTAFLLVDEPLAGGFASQGPALTLTDGPGLDVRVRER